MKQAILIHLDKPRQLRYRHAALSALEQHFGCKMAEMGGKLGNPGVDDIDIFLWAGLLWEDKTLTLEAIGDLIDNGESDYGAILPAVAEAFRQAFGQPKNVTGPEAKSGTGKKR